METLESGRLAVISVILHFRPWLVILFLCQVFFILFFLKGSFFFCSRSKIAVRLLLLFYYISLAYRRTCGICPY